MLRSSSRIRWIPMTRWSWQCGSFSSRSLVQRCVVSLHPDNRVDHPRLTRLPWQRFAEFVKRPQPGFQRFLEAVLRHPPFKPQEGQPGPVGRLCRPRRPHLADMQRVRVAHQQGGLRGVEL